jgi:hypothetical protein
MNNNEMLIFSFNVGSFVQDEPTIIHDSLYETNNTLNLCNFIPTPWQVSISPNGKYISTMHSSKLTCTSSNNKNNTSSLDLPQLLEINPRARQINWSKCSNYMLILSSEGLELYIVSRNCEILFSISIDLLIKKENKEICLKVIPISHHPNSSSVVDNDIILVNLIFSNGNIVTGRICINISKFQIMSTSNIGKLIQDNQNDSNLNKSMSNGILGILGMKSKNKDYLLVENSFWLNNSSIMILICQKSDSNTNEAIVYAIKYDSSVNVHNSGGNRWKVLQELAFSRSQPIETTLHQSRGIQQKIDNYLNSNNINNKYILPIIDIVSNPDER